MRVFLAAGGAEESPREDVQTSMSARQQPYVSKAIGPLAYLALSVITRLAQPQPWRLTARRVVFIIV